MVRCSSRITDSARAQYMATNPFEWMDMISLQGKTNFFEKRVGDYQKSGVMSSVSGDGKGQAFRLDADF
jgi:ribonucleotide reductase beta subunit family protein with ferritin-like domain